VFTKGGSLCCRRAPDDRRRQWAGRLRGVPHQRRPGRDLQGTDPSDATNWSLVGVYSLPKPIGDRCLIESGVDLLVVTEAGILPLTAALRTPEEEQAKIALSRKINPSVADAASSYGSLFGWQPILYPGRGGLLIVNVPTAELSTSMQYVRSMDQGGWCRFTGINAICWATANGKIYFGATDGVYRWDIGASDNSEPIVADVLPAFQDFGNRTVTKAFTMVRALMRARPSSSRRCRW
jgi:hypothetical protein